jgi:hypothetical protein
MDSFFMTEVSGFDVVVVAVERVQSNGCANRAASRAPSLAARDVIGCSTRSNATEQQ